MAPQPITFIYNELKYSKIINYQLIKLKYNEFEMK